MRFSFAVGYAESASGVVISLDSGKKLIIACEQISDFAPYPGFKSTQEDAEIVNQLIKLAQEEDLNLKGE